MLLHFLHELNNKFLSFLDELDPMNDVVAKILSLICLRLLPSTRYLGLVASTRLDLVASPRYLVVSGYIFTQFFCMIFAAHGPSL